MLAESVPEARPDVQSYNTVTNTYAEKKNVVGAERGLERLRGGDYEVRANVVTTHAGGGLRGADRCGYRPRGV